MGGDSNQSNLKTNSLAQLEHFLSAARSKTKVNEECETSVLALIGYQPDLRADAILLMKRTDFVETHKGQVCFPGGYREDHDASLLQTALRETQEEIGVDASQIKILGPLSPVQTRGQICIQPFVGSMTFPFPFQLNPREVERVFYLPVNDLVTRGLEKVSVEVGEYKVFSEGIKVDDELVWGATARMLSELRKILTLNPSR